MEDLKRRRIELHKNISHKKTLLENARRIYVRRKFEYDDLLDQYKKIDYELAELDGRLVNVTFVRQKKKTKTTKLSDLNLAQIEELKKSLLKSIE